MAKIKKTLKTFGAKKILYFNMNVLNPDFKNASTDFKK